MNRFAKSSSKWQLRNWKHFIKLRDVIIFSLLPLLLILYIATASVVDYLDAQHVAETWFTWNSLEKSFKKHLQTAVNIPRLMSFRLKLSPDEIDVPVISLRTEGDLWDAWQGKPLALWGQWIDADLLRGNNFQPVKLRKRGDTSKHWNSAKKSFTLKTKRSSLFKGYRKLAFSGKRILSTYMTHSLATEFGLLEPFTTITPVFINEQFYGLFRVIEFVDESFLRSHGRIPGDIFRGDAFSRGERFKGLQLNLFSNPYIWDRVAFNNRVTDAEEPALWSFLSDLNGTTFEAHLRFMNWIDPDEMARLIAYLFITGDPYHMDFAHNQLLYMDPSSGMLHVIPWDIILWKLEQGSTTLASKFLQEILRNPFIYDKALGEIYQKLEDDRLFGTAERLVRDIYEQYRDFFRYEELRSHSIPYMISPDDVLSELQYNIRYLKDWFRKADIAVHIGKPESDTIILDFEARGYVGNDLHAIEMNGKPDILNSVKLIADHNLNGILDDSDTEMSIRREKTSWGGKLLLTSGKALLPGIKFAEKGITPSPVHYRFFITATGLENEEISVIGAELRNRLTGEPANTIELNEGDQVSSGTSWHPWQYPVPSPVEHRLHGDTTLKDTLVIPEGDTLIIEAGTTVWMDPEVSILARGRITALGTEERPITFQPAVDGWPWGAIALQGKGVSGSVFEHVKFEGGGGASLERVEYTGMVSVYNTDEVFLRHCSFADNVRSDDAFHAVHAHIELHECTFLRTNADAVDLDYSSGYIQNCKFKNSGNDAIDLMTSSPSIIGNYITGSKDKGISIGEKSHPFIFNNYISDSFRGVENRDRSEPLLVHNVIKRNRIGVHQNVKNWRYGGGGWAKLVKTVISENETDLLIDKESRLTVYDSETRSNIMQPADGTAYSGFQSDYSWIFAHYGIKLSTTDPGIVSDWIQTDTISPRVSIIFEDNFDRISTGWEPAGGTTRLEKSGQDLVASIQNRRGSMYQSVNWDLSDKGFTYIAVFEIAGQNVESAALSFSSDKGNVINPFELADDLSSYAFVTTRLNPAKYSEMKLTAVPGHYTGKIRLHMYRLYAIPQVAVDSNYNTPVSMR